jgi:hypothetical protein
MLAAQWFPAARNRIFRSLVSMEFLIAGDFVELRVSGLGSRRSVCQTS